MTYEFALRQPLPPTRAFYASIGVDDPPVIATRLLPPGRVTSHIISNLTLACDACAFAWLLARNRRRGIMPDYFLLLSDATWGPFLGTAKPLAQGEDSGVPPWMAQYASALRSSTRQSAPTVHVVGAFAMAAHARDTLSTQPTGDGARWVTQRTQSNRGAFGSSRQAQEENLLSLDGLMIHKAVKSLCKYYATKACNCSRQSGPWNAGLFLSRTEQPGGHRARDCQTGKAPTAGTPHLRHDSHWQPAEAKDKGL